MAKELNPSVTLAAEILKLLAKCSSPVPRAFLDRQLLKLTSPNYVTIMSDTLLALSLEDKVHKMFLDPHTEEGYDSCFKDTSVYWWLASKTFDNFHDMGTDTSKYFVGLSIEDKDAGLVKDAVKGVKIPSQSKPKIDVDKDKDTNNNTDEGEGEGKDEEEHETASKPLPKVRAKSKPGSLDSSIEILLEKSSCPLTKKDIFDSFVNKDPKVISLRLGYLVMFNNAKTCRNEDDVRVYWHPNNDFGLEPDEPKVKMKAKKKVVVEQSAVTTFMRKPEEKDLVLNKDLSSVLDKSYLVKDLAVLPLPKVLGEDNAVTNISIDLKGKITIEMSTGNLAFSGTSAKTLINFLGKLKDIDFQA